MRSSIPTLLRGAFWVVGGLVPREGYDLDFSWILRSYFGFQINLWWTTFLLMPHPTHWYFRLYFMLFTKRKNYGLWESTLCFYDAMTFHDTALPLTFSFLFSLDLGLILNHLALRTWSFRPFLSRQIVFSPKHLLSTSNFLRGWIGLAWLGNLMNGSMVGCFMEGWMIPTQLIAYSLFHYAFAFAFRWYGTTQCNTRYALFYLLSSASCMYSTTT